MVAFSQCQEEAVYAHRQLRGFWSADDYYGFMNTFKYDEEKLILYKYTLIEPERTRQVYNWQQCYSPESLSSELLSCGLVVKETLADVAGSPYTDDPDVIAFVAVKQ